jgi:hypothetical protein
MNLDIEQAWTLSTAHIPATLGPDHPSRLDFGDNHPRCDPHEHGWIVFLVASDERPCPEWFRPIMDVAVKNDVSFVVFDSSGGDVNDLHSYEW